MSSAYPPSSPKLSAQLGEPLDLSEQVKQLKAQFGLNHVPIRKRLTTLVEEALAETKKQHLAALAERDKASADHA